MRTYYVGDVAKLMISVRKDNALTDPEGLKLKVKPPQASPQEYVFGSNVEIVRDETGKYHAMIPVTKTGRWNYRWESSGPGTTGAVEKAFDVAKTAF